MSYYKTLVIILFLTLVISLSSAVISYNIDAPKEVQIGKWFNVSVFISSYKQENVTLYSYVYRDLNVVSQGWTANKKEISLEPGKQTNVTLEDMIKYNTEEGVYNLRVRLRYGGEILNETFPLKVHAETKVFEESYLYFILIVVSVIGLGLIFVSRR